MTRPWIPIRGHLTFCVIYLEQEVTFSPSLQAPTVNGRKCRLQLS
jgi:hypothetical protein